MRTVTVEEAADAAAAGRVLLLDVREDEEWAAGHAPGSVHVPLSALHPGAFPLGVPFVAVCRSGNRSHRAAAALTEAGADAADMAGGLQAWAAAGLPLVDAHGAPGHVV